MTDISTSPYLLDEPPTSTGKALLARAVSHWCALHYGLDPEEIAAAFTGDADHASKSEVRVAARLIGELIAAGDLRSFVRPFGGGDPERLPASTWELDDFQPRVARSAMNLTAPFSSDADPTHWIFVDLEDFNRIIQTSCADVVPTARSADRQANSPSVLREIPPPLTEDRHVRMPELVRRTGMSRSTIYRRMEQGRFPTPIPMDGSISAWWESDVAAWLANPR